MALPFLATLLISLVLTLVSYMLMPRPKQPKPDSMTEKMDTPTAEAGREIPVVFGTVLIESPNVLWFGNKSTETREIDA